MARLDYAGLQHYDEKIKDYIGDSTGAVVEVQPTQPTDAGNKVWIKTSEEEFELAEQKDVNELKSALSTFVNAVSARFTWEQGNLNTDTGASRSTDKNYYIRTTTYTKSPYGFRFVVPSGKVVRAYKYSDAAYTSYIGYTNYIGPATVEIADATNYYKFTIFYESLSSTISPSDNTSVEQYLLIQTDDTMTKQYKAADAKAIGQYINKQCKIKIEWEQGQYRTDMGGGSSSTTIIRSIYQVPFKQYISITVPEGYKLKWFQYTGISYTTFTKSSDWLTGTVKVYEDGNWYKFCLAKTDDTALAPSDVKNIDFNVLVGEKYDTVSEEYEQYAAIVMVAILSCYDTVYLGRGTYPIRGTIILSDNQSIIGQGFGTILRFIDSASGACIKCSNGNTVKDLQIVGRDADYVIESDDPTDVVPSTMGDRHGIELTGTIKRGVISNCYIHGFNGYGVYAHNIGSASDQGFSISDCYCVGNHGGIYTQNAEFFRISQCDCNRNYIGMFLGGGNNTITACNFSSNYYGISMDNEDGESTNNTHGEVVACIMQHNRTNAVYINNMKSGEIFSACNMDNGGVSIINAYRITFNACNFMDTFSINVSGGGLVLFNGCMMRDYTDTHTTITNNNAVKFINCFKAGGSPADPTA